ncbi:VanW family protein [Catenulispora yoronensis]
MRIDYAATVAAASSGRSDPLVALPALVGKGRDVPLQVTVDRVALRAALAKVTAGFDRTMVDGGVAFPNGVPTPIAPRPGRQVDLDAAVNAVAGAFDDGVASVRLAALGHGVAIAPVGYAMPEKAPVKMPEKAPEKMPEAVVSAGSEDTPAASVQAGPAFPATPVALVVHDVQPTVTPAVVAQAMQDLARPAMAAPVTLVTGSVKTVFKPPMLGRFLAIVPDGRGGLTPKLDGQGLRGEIDHDALAKLEQPATDATFTVTNGEPVLVPGKNGTGYAPAAIQNAVVPVLTKTSTAQRVVAVPIGPLPPALTTEAAQALGVKDVMGTYTAPFAATTQRTANVRRAADLVRGQVVQAGQTLSLNQVIGPRTAANGFVPAGVAGAAGAAAVAQGEVAAVGGLDAGAGTSMVATALFNAEYLAGLKDVEHHPHAVVTDHFPPGLEAAVAYPDVDLKFQNDSGAPVYLWTATTENAVTVAVLGQKAYDSVQTETSPHYAQVAPRTTGGSGGSCVATDGVPGFQVDVTRILAKAGQDPIRQVFHTSYAAQDRVVCGAGTGGSAAGAPAGGSATGGPTGFPATGTGGAATSPNRPTGSPTGGTGGEGGTAGGATSPSPTGGGTPTGGATSGSASPPAAGWDGSLLGGLLGAPASKR